VPLVMIQINKLDSDRSKIDLVMSLVGSSGLFSFNSTGTNALLEHSRLHRKAFRLSKDIL
jgi:hypothetical protein